MDVLIQSIPCTPDGPGDKATVSVGVLAVSGDEVTVQIGSDVLRATTEIPLVPGERFGAILVPRGGTIVLRKMGPAGDRAASGHPVETGSGVVPGRTSGPLSVSAGLARVLQSALVPPGDASRRAQPEGIALPAADDSAARLPMPAMDSAEPGRAAQELAELVRECIRYEARHLAMLRTAGPQRSETLRRYEPGARHRSAPAPGGDAPSAEREETGGSSSPAALTRGAPSTEGENAAAISRSPARARAGLLESARFSVSDEHADLAFDLPLAQEASRAPAARLRIERGLPGRKKRSRRAWRFSLEADFPGIGHVAATGMAEGERFLLRLVFSDASAAYEAAARASELEESLRGTGVRTVSVSCTRSPAEARGRAGLDGWGVDVIV